MSKYIIDGSFPINGTVTASGNKNAALPCIAACLLTDEEIVIGNLPDIEDVRVMFEVLQELGANVKNEGGGVYRVKTLDIKTSEIPSGQARAIRASILFAGPLLARTGKVILPPPGGDVIGRRRLDTHFMAFTELGARVEMDGVYKLVANKLVGVDIFLDEASVTATENAIMAAVLASGKTVIRNAASEPHVQDLCSMLNAMGANISGIGSNILYIDGVKKLTGAEFDIGSDFMEVGSYIGLAAVTRGELTIKKAAPEHLRMVKLGFGRLGIHWETSGGDIHIPSGLEMKVNPDLGGMIPKIDDAPWPGFPADLTSIMLTVATQVEGTVLIHEKMFESRMFFVDKLIGMGARIILCDPHRAVVSGPARLRASYLISPDVRAGMAMVIAALCAEGQSVIANVYQIERGYEDLSGRLQSLGARIQRVDD
ncbi:MAG: UDP-N-acetylglucosamine 1-carboxyvinyltransferase [Spirochaetales bacterium]|uniref:UDP-N-acetylglucosamine 1-carboxyvinyltransferase n=1 Tax=Candidatus Thalassospirochaeta sargassi TaxID=3119039 RepID=A0AAJ1MJ21_9SPIO|nr:UDP-N-acetylglucosamine 1-carboxyvinyltransferase [Spirochaetales bacterium]